MSCEEIRVFAVKFGQDFDLYFADDEGKVEICLTFMTLDYLGTRVKMESTNLLKSVLRSTKPSLECDNWKKEHSLQHQIFRNTSNQVLVVQPGPENTVTNVFESMADQEMIPGCGVHFTIHYYKDYTLEEGLPVAFSVLVENKTYCMYCTHESGEKTIRFREEEVPREIHEQSSDIIFIQKSVSPIHTKAFKFESSLMRGYFLAFQKEEDLSKLILKQCENEDQVDESIYMTVSQIN
ncbi:interleukin-18 [Natator depressus]|uniref:interleukin-18 n=1 Tax=Natator depressus TaxID=27790 RepID=UPI003EBA63B8